MLATLLQSATAVGILAVGFAGAGIISIGAGIAALLGADLGSALVVKLLSFDLGAMIPVLLLTGATLFLKVERRQIKYLGRILLGIGFILMSLQMVGQATAPLRDSAALPQVVAYLQGDPLSAFAMAALLSWLVHSSVATLLLFASLASAGVLPVEAAAPMVLGANLGGALVAVWLTRGAAWPARRIPMANLIFRGVAAIAALLLLQIVPGVPAFLGGGPSTQLVNLHLLFNAALLILALPIVGPVERLTARLWPDPAEGRAVTAGYQSALDRSLLARPRQALLSAQRELIRMAEATDAMLRPVIDLLDSDDIRPIAALRARDDEVNQRHTGIKLYIAELNRGELSFDEARRGLELTSQAIDFEAIGDLIVKNLLDQAEERARRHLQFSAEGWKDLTVLHARVMANMQLALNVMVSGDVETARQLVAEKPLLRRMERDCHDRHLARLRGGQETTIETSDIHLEIVRSLKEINSLLVKVAYPILTENGDLLESRLSARGASTELMI